MKHRILGMMDLQLMKDEITMNFKKFYKQYINEANVKKLYQQYVENPKRMERRIPKEDFNQLVEIDPSSTNKYLPWMIKRYFEERDRDLFNHLKIIIPRFHELTSSKRITGKETNIFQYKTSEDLYDKIKYYEKDELSRSQIKKGIKSIEDIDPKDIVWKNDKLVIVLPPNREKSCKYGRNTKWCTSGSTDNYFSRYYFLNHANLYYFLPLVDDFKNTDMRKVAAVKLPDGSEEFRDAPDNRISRSTVDSWLKKLGTSYNELFK